MIWFRVQHEDGDDYRIYAKLGTITFQSEYRFKKEEFADIVKQMIKVDYDDEGEET